MKIKRIAIDKLFGKYNIRQEIDDKLSIFVGNNGTFKTTLLNILYDMLCLHTNLPNYRLEHADMQLTEDKEVEYWMINNMTRPQFHRFVKANDDLSVHSEELDSSIFGRIQKDDVPVSNFFVMIPKNKGTEMDNERFVNMVDADYITTYDVKKETPKDKSLLDLQLEKLQSEYGYYLSDLAKKTRYSIEENGRIDVSKYKEIYYFNNLFRNLINDTFQATHKQLDGEESRLTFKLEDGYSITSANLSSGEKQLLIIYLTVLLQRNRECILLMDEPEISLHVDWQYSLLDNIYKLNPNVQVIMTTHSPMIFGSGWGDKVMYMEDITTKGNE